MRRWLLSSVWHDGKHLTGASAPNDTWRGQRINAPFLAPELDSFIRAGKPVLVTDGLAKALANFAQLTRANGQILPAKGQLKSLLQLTQPELDGLRVSLLKQVKSSFKAPNRVVLYLFKDRNWVVEDFNDDPVTI